MTSDKNDNIKFTTRYSDIPDVFFSSHTNSPIEHCISCDRFLLEPGTAYIIEKAVKHYTKLNTSDTIFEYAMCIECYKMIHQRFSNESLERIQLFFREHVDFQKRRSDLLRRETLNINDWISSCIVHGTRIHELEEYQIGGQFDGRSLIYHDLPYMVGLRAMDDVAQLLSNKTLDEMDGFYKKFLGPPPDIEEILDRHRFVLL